MKKKRVVIPMICLIIIACLCIFISSDSIYAAESQTVINGVTVNWSYTINEDEKIENLECTNKSELIGNIEIPSAIDGKEVTSLAMWAFSGSNGITGIIIPDTIENISPLAFSGCKNLKNVDLGNVKSIDFDAFSGCTAIEEIFIPKTVTGFSSGAPFKGCINLKKITLEEGMTDIPMWLCAGTAIEEIIIPDTVEEISDLAFSDCTNLKTVDLGNVKGIGQDAFSGCTAIEEIFIPKTVTNSSTGAPFRGCTNLKKITLEEGMTDIPMYLCAGTAIEEIIIPNSVSLIGYDALANCSNLKKITILDNVDAMGFALSNDEVFKNHNEDLTIYCYRDTMAAKHAIKFNIKYVYLDRPSTGDTDENEDNTEPKDDVVIEEPENNVDNTENNDNNNENVEVTTSENPKTGDIMFYVVMALGLASVVFVVTSKVIKKQASMKQ